MRNKLQLQKILNKHDFILYLKLKQYKKFLKSYLKANLNFLNCLFSFNVKHMHFEFKLHNIFTIR